MRLSAEERARYARQLALPEIGEAGQQRLAAGRVLVVGAGGLGSPAALYLAAAGVGTLGIVDGDVVDASNLQRQILHPTASLGQPKALSAAATLRAINPGIEVRPLVARLTAGDGPALLANYDFIIDATDNFASKFLIADLCHAAGKPYSHAGIARFCGQALTVLPGRTACYRCVFEAPPATSDGPPQGPLGAVPGVVGAIQATEALKFLLGAASLLTDRLFVYDAWRLTARCVRVARRADCPLCGKAGHKRSEDA
jgi:molybdopterin/thiamine biosynthesis adenylyltransferase